MDNNYRPISCSFYDRLEAAATLGKEVHLKYFLGKDIRLVKCRIKTILIKDKIEWLLLENQERIRLDQIESLDGIKR